MANIDFDISSLFSGLNNLEKAAEIASRRGLMAIADEVLRLSAKEVPLDKGLLLNSSDQEFDGDDVIVGYNKEYAAYQHEGHWPDGSHQIRNHQHGRKSHYLIDPITQNLSVFEEVWGSSISSGMFG
jgi:hypothetical protein